MISSFPNSQVKSATSPRCAALRLAYTEHSHHTGAQFGFLASINNLIDLASVGLIGQKAGFSSPLDAQIKGVLNITAVALRSVAEAVKTSQREHLAEVEESRRTREDREGLMAQIERNGGVHDGRVDCVSGSGAMSELGVGIERDRPDDVCVRRFATTS